MSKICCLLVVLAVVGTNCSPFRFGGSAGAKSHTEAGAGIGGAIGKNADGSLGATARGNLRGDWTGGAASGGYIGHGSSQYNPDNDITGAGLGGIVTAHLGGATGGVAGANYNNGKLTGDASSVSSIDKSASASGSGFLGSVQQKEAEYIGAYGDRSGNMLAAGAPFGAQFNGYSGYQPYGYGGYPYGGYGGGPYGLNGPQNGPGAKEGDRKQA